MPVILFVCKREICGYSKKTTKKPHKITNFLFFFSSFPQELHDPTEASLESTGHGGYLCKPGGE